MVEESVHQRLPAELRNFATPFCAPKSRHSDGHGADETHPARGSNAGAIPIIMVPDCCSEAIESFGTGYGNQHKTGI